MKSKDNVKTRFKLYKAGKMWLIAGTTFLALAGLGSVAVHADSNNLNTQSAQSTVETNQDVKVESTQSQDNNVVTVQNNDVTTPAQADSNKQDNSATDSKNATVPAQTDSNKQDNSAAENKDATPAQSDSNKQDNSATDNKNAADQANSTSVNSDTTSNTNANNQKVALLAADNQTDGWNTDHTQYTQGGQLLTGVHNIDGTYYDFDENHNIVKNNYVQSQWGLWYMFGDDGRISTDVTAWSGTYYYFDHSTYLRVDNDYVQSRWGDWYMFGNDGRVASGVTAWNGTYYYFDPITHLRVDNNYVQSQWGLWYMFGNDGRIVTGLVDWYGSKYYFDENTYTKVTNDWRDTYLGHAHFNSDGVLDAVSDAQKAQQLENIADQFLGWGYVWGGNNPSTGFDCSGLTQYIMSQIGISIARTASDQYANSRHISAGQAQKGDLVYFCEGGSVIHAGLYIGNGLMIDAQVAGVGIGVHRVSQLSSYYPAVYGRYLNL